jgi:hypothetical protein
LRLWSGVEVVACETGDVGGDVLVHGAAVVDGGLEAGDEAVEGAAEVLEVAAFSVAPGAVPKAGAFLRAPSLRDGMISVSSSSRRSARNCR